MLKALVSVTVYDLILYAAMFEFAVLGITFVLIVCILSVKTALFMLKVTLDHAFPNWRRSIATHRPEPKTSV